MAANRAMICLGESAFLRRFVFRSGNICHGLPLRGLDT